MTLTSEQAWGDPPRFAKADAVTLRATGGHRFILRGTQRFFGASFSVAALALWLFPIANGSAAELLCKLMVTLVLGFIGASLWQSGSPTPTPELEIDLVRREVRLVRWYGETKSLVTRRRFRDLSKTEFDDLNVRLWDDEGDLLAELTLPDMAALDNLRRSIEESQKRVPLAA